MANRFSPLFARKPVAEMALDDGTGLKRTLGAGDLIMLAIGAVIGTGIVFWWPPCCGEMLGAGTLRSSDSTTASGCTPSASAS